MSNRPLPLALLFLLLPSLLGAGGDESDPARFVLDEFLLQTLPGGAYPSNFIEMMAPDVTSAIEESNGFAALDVPRAYQDGLSSAQTTWQYDGFRVNSALDDGAPAFSLPRLAQSEFRLQAQTPWDGGAAIGVASDPAGNGLRVALSGTLPRMGGHTALGWLLVPNLASERGQVYAAQRRRLTRQYSADLLWRRRSETGSLLLAASWLDQGRQFNSLQAPADVYHEGGNLLQLFGRWRRSLDRGRLSVSLAFNRLQRDNLGAELGRTVTETLAQHKDSGFAGVALEGSRSRVRLSLVFEKDRRRSPYGNWTKELQDRDGDGFWPFARQGDFSAVSLRGQAEHHRRVRLFGRQFTAKPFVEWEWDRVRGAEEVPAFNALTAGRLPYQVLLWTPGTPYRHHRLDLSGGLAGRLALTGRLDVQARLFLRGQALSFNDAATDLSDWTPGYDAGIVWRPGRRWNAQLAFGRIPLAFGAQTSFFLETQRPTAEVWDWEDGNGNRSFQFGEQANLRLLSGGSTHAAAAGLRAPVQQRLLALLSVDLGKGFRFDLKGILGRQFHQLAVRYSDEFGFYFTENDRTLYFLKYLVDGYRLTNDGGEPRNPFYSELLMRVSTRVQDRWFFSLSFLSHMAMGVTPFGTGASNDAGLIDESQADPNTWRNGFGRLNGDRAFVSKVFFGWQPRPRLFVAASVRYRDGTPFAFIDTVRRFGQWVLTYRTIKAEDENGVKGGPRADCVWDANVQVNWRPALFRGRVALQAAFFNLLDFGSELTEYAFSPSTRQANELQLPRSLRLGVVVDL